MAGKVTFQIIAEDAQAEATMERFFSGTQRKGQQAGKNIGNSFDQATQSMMNMAGAVSVIATIQNAVRKIGDEWEDVKRKRDAALGKQVGVAVARARAIENLPEGITVKQLEADVAKVAAFTKLPQEQVFNLFSGLLSAKGAFGRAEVLDAAKIGGKMARLVGQDPQARGGAILDFMRVAAAENPNAKAAAGALLQLKQSARIEEGDDLAQRVGGLTSLVARGLSEEEARELVATASTAGGEKLAAKPFVAATRLGAAFERGGFEGTLAQRVAGVQQAYAEGSPQERRALEKSFSIGDRNATPGLALLRNTPQFQGAFANAQAVNLPVGPQTAATVDRFFANVANSDIQANADLAAAGGQIVEAQQLGNIRGAKKAAARNILEGGLGATTGVGKQMRRVASAVFGVASEGFADADPVAAGAGAVAPLASRRFRGGIGFATAGLAGAVLSNIPGSQDSIMMLATGLNLLANETKRANEQREQAKAEPQPMAAEAAAN